MSNKQELERAKKRLLDAIAASRVKVKVINNDGISVQYQKQNYFFSLPSNSNTLGRSN